jgi:hypothetical protein
MTAPLPVAGVGIAANGPGVRVQMVGGPVFVTVPRIAAALPALALFTLVTATVLLASPAVSSMLAAAGIVLRPSSRQPATPKARSTPPANPS